MRCLTRERFSAWCEELGGDRVVMVVTACYAVETRWMRCRDRVRFVRTSVGEGAAEVLDGISGERIDLLLSTGFCGASEARLHRGDLVLAERVLHRGEHVLLDRALVRRAQEILTEAGFEATVGTVASSATVADRASKDRFRQQGALSVDMESGPLSCWADARRIPFLSLRGVLDEAGDHVPFSPQSSLVRSVLSHPLAAWRAGRWASRAGRTLGGALDALVLALEERS